MFTQHIALVPEAGGVSASDLARVSAALQKQVTRDLAPAWALSATVDAFPRLEDMPVGYWPIVVSLCELGRESGIHLDENGQPYAQVEASRDSLSWSLAASRACVNMLVNPYGDRTVTAPSMRSQQGLVEYALDIAGPCAAAQHTYSVNDVVVADFCLPAFFGWNASSEATRYSYCGNLTTPFQLLRGGHLLWLDPVSNRWWLRNYWDDVPVDVNLGTIERRLVSVRELVRSHQPVVKARAMVEFEAQASLNRRHALGASQARAHRLRALLGARLDSQALIELDASEEQELDANDKPPLQIEQELTAGSSPSPSLSIVVEPEGPILPSTAAHSRFREVDMDGDDEVEQLIESLDDMRHDSRARSQPPPVPGSPGENSKIATPDPHREDRVPELPTFGDPPGAGRRLGMIFSATTGALLVLLAWGGRPPIVRSAASARGAPALRTVARAPIPASTPRVATTTPLAATPAALAVAAPVAKVPPAQVVDEARSEPARRNRRKNAERPDSATEPTSSTGPRGGQKQAALDDLVNTRR